LDRLLDKLDRLEQQNAELVAQLHELRAENAALRRQSPSVSTTPQLPVPSPSASLLPAPFSSARPRSPLRDAPAGGDVEMSPSRIPDTKRSRLQQADVIHDTGAEPVPTPGVSSGHGF
jgi:hypothetical protein